MTHTQKTDMLDKIMTPEEYTVIHRLKQFDTKAGLGSGFDTFNAYSFVNKFKITKNEDGLYQLNNYFNYSFSKIVLRLILSEKELDVLSQNNLKLEAVAQYEKILNPLNFSKLILGLAEFTERNNDEGCEFIIVSFRKALVDELTLIQIYCSLHNLYSLDCNKFTMEN